MLQFNRCSNRNPELIIRDHSFPRQIFPNSADQFAKFRGSPRRPVYYVQGVSAGHALVHAEWTPAEPG